MIGRPADPERRPRAVVVELVLLAFLALTAIGGGIEMLLFPKGNPFVKAEWLDSVPFDDWVVPGLILGIALGLGSVLVLWGVLRRPHIGWLDRLATRTGHHWSWLASMLLGAGLILWIGLEVALIPERSVVEAIYLAVGAALLLRPFVPTASSYLRGSDITRLGT